MGSVGGEVGVSDVVDLQLNTEKTFTLTRDAYGDGDGNVKISIRGQLGAFLWGDGEPPNWEVYTIPITRTWRYVQLKIEWSA